jgi:hypothetical protein
MQGILAYYWTRLKVLAPFLRWLLHVAAVITTVILLGYLNAQSRLDLVLLSPFPRLHTVWLPLLYLLMYGLMWLMWWLYRLLGPDNDFGEFPDIDKAWDEALTALEGYGIEPKETPLFLVLGRPPGGDFAPLFTAANLPLLVRNVPAAPAAPLRIYAGKYGIFVTCEGASLLGKHFEEVETTSPPTPDAEAPSKLTQDDVARRDMEEATRGLIGMNKVSLIPQVIRAGDVARRELDDLFGAPKEVDTSNLLRNADEVERITRRLRYLCKRINQRRAPYCPVNGLLWLLPLKATDNNAAASQAAIACRRDLTTLRATLQVACPSVVVVYDLHKLPGYPTLLAAVPEGEARERQVGQTFPLLPDLSADERPLMVETGLRWVDQTYFPGLIYQMFGLETESAQRWSIVRSNLQLFRALAGLRRRRPHLSRITARGFDDTPLLLAGCYLAAAAPDAKQQAFVAGAVRQLFAAQNAVLWTTDAESEERTYAWLMWIGYLALLLLVVGLVYVTWQVWR